MNTETVATGKPAANTQHTIHPLIAKRWSPRAFSTQQIDRETILSLFEAARWAPSSYNEQPWRFIYATPEQPEAFAKLAACLVPGNKEWAEQAPLLVAAITRNTYSGNGKVYRHNMHDLGLALGNLTIEATSRELYLRQMGGFDAERLRQSFDIPAEYQPATMLAIGYLGQPEQLPEAFRGAEWKAQQRKPLDDIAFEGYFKA